LPFNADYLSKLKNTYSNSKPCNNQLFFNMPFQQPVIFKPTTILKKVSPTPTTTTQQTPKTNQNKNKTQETYVRTPLGRNHPTTTTKERKITPKKNLHKR
jgi:hypothetical protein